MRCVINCYSRNELSMYNGLTFPIVGHCNGHVEVDINGIINDIHPGELFIVDIETEFTHAKYRSEKLGFDYWHSLLLSYLKLHKINFKPKEIPKEKAEVKEIDTTFVEIEDINDIFSHQ